eukprot:m.256203 g.256203  ORF g.256203 m.256203 type:complete len:60 (-) comp15950_c0_seq8:5107-5286(-)
MAGVDSRSMVMAENMTGMTTSTMMIIMMIIMDTRQLTFVFVTKPCPLHQSTVPTMQGDF